MTDGPIGSVAPALVFVIGLVWLAGYAARRGWLRFARSPAPAARTGVLETVAIDARRRLHLIRCGDRHVLLLTGGTQDMVLLFSDCLRETKP
jgi:flagellar biogenesis protein FliO